MGGLVSFDLCEGNPGALSFMMEAYMEHNPFLAERGFERMRDSGITGTRLYMFWNDCCNRNTELAVKIMCEHEIEDITRHINYQYGRGIAYEETAVNERK